MKKINKSILITSSLIGSFLIGSWTENYLNNIRDINQEEISNHQEKIINGVIIPAGIYSVVNLNSNYPWKELEVLNFISDKGNNVFVQDSREEYKPDDLNVIYNLNRPLYMKYSLDESRGMYVFENGRYDFYFYQIKNDKVDVKWANFTSYNCPIGLMKKLVP